MACTRKPAGIPTGSGRVAYEFCRWLEKPSLSTNEPDIFGILDSVMPRLRRRPIAAQTVGPAADYKINPEYTSTSPDGTITIEQYAKIAADGSYTWQFWARRGDKLTLLKPEQPDYAAGFRFHQRFRNGSCECKKPAPGKGAYTSITWVRRDRCGDPKAAG